MTKRLVIDPVTRIEGHLRIEGVVEGGKVVDAYSSGTMFRGLELILPGRDPRDAWAITQRVCGVCTTVHALASLRAVEDALDIRVPPNANIIRNIMELAQYVQDHVIHFYHLHALDWVDVLSALKADPQETSRIAQSLSSWSKSSPGHFSDLQARLTRFASGGQLGPFANGYWGHPSYKLPPEVNLLAVSHYLDMLEWQKEIIKIHAVFGGKNPHPNYLVGGMACVLDPNEMTAINAEKLALVGQLIDDAIRVVDQVYLPDLFAIGGIYKDAGPLYGGGLGNFLAYGDLPQTDIREPDSFLFPRGAVLGRNLSEVHEVDPTRPEEIQEFVARSYYEYSKGKDAGLHPFEGETRPKYTGPRPPYEQLDVDNQYSWLKSPRWKGNAMEVGPLARMVVAYARGRTDVKDIVGDALGRLKVGPEALFSTLGRTLARGLETKLCAGYLRQQFDKLVANIKAGDLATVNHQKWEPSTWPKEAKGVGLTEAPRGALGHWVHIQDGKIASYQLVVPTTWNGSPRDPKGQRGAFEAALLDTPVAMEDQPLEMLRTVHSFDPCIACSVHVVDLAKSAA